MAGMSSENEAVPLGRRERKKAATRQAIADAALRLFLERGYDQVSIKEIADEADVSTTTLFKHFSGKEALVFDEDASIELMLVEAVREREPGTSVPAALKALALRRLTQGRSAQEGFSDYSRLVRETPVLSSYAHRMWMRHEGALARVIAEESGLPEGDETATALAHFALDAVSLARDSGDPKTVVDKVFALLENGFTAVTSR